MKARINEISRELDATGTYTQTTKELEFGARTAWRNASRVSTTLYFSKCRSSDFSGLDLFFPFNMNFFL